MKTVIIIIVIIGLAAVAGPIIIGIRSFDGTVTEHPYRKGLVWDEIQKKKNELGWKIGLREKQFRTGDNDITISIVDKNGNAVPASSVSVKISRPSTMTYDRYFDAVQTGKGLFASRVHFPLFGYWDMEMNVMRGKESLIFKKRIFVAKGGDTACLINEGPCIRYMGREGIKVVFDIHPKPVLPMKELIYTVVLTDKGSPVTDASVTVDLTMPGMFMGINRPVLTHAVDGTYEGRGVIQACPHGGKIWKAEVRTIRQGKTASTGFTFEVK